MQTDGAPTPPGEVTRLLQAFRSGDHAAMDRIVPLVYDDLRLIARRYLRREFGDGAMRPTSLVHEAYMKMAHAAALSAGDRPHFLAIASLAMRQLLVDDARRRRASKRGGSWVRVTFGDRGWNANALGPEDLMALNQAIDELEPRQRQVVEYRFFGGMEEQEIAEVLGVSDRTVRRDWLKARAWLYRALYGTKSD